MVRWLLALTHICAMFFWSSCEVVGAETAESGWVISQKHKMNGRQDLLICPTKIRIDNIDLGYSVIADANSKSVTVFNASKCVRFRQPIDRIVSKIARASIYINIEIPLITAWTKITEQRISGMRSECYSCDEKASKFSGQGRGGYLAGKKRSVIVTHTVWFNKEIPIAKSLSTVVSDLQGAPHLGGIALRMQSQSTNLEAPTLQFDTIRIARQKISSKQFVVPANFKDAKHISEVTSGDSALLEELLGGTH